MRLNWALVTCLIVLLSIGLTMQTVDAGKKSKEENEEEESRSEETDTDTETDSDDDDDDDDDKKGNTNKINFAFFIQKVENIYFARMILTTDRLAEFNCHNKKKN